MNREQDFLQEKLRCHYIFPPNHGYDRTLVKYHAEVSFRAP